MDEYDKRRRVTLYKTILGVSEILCEEEELTDFNFTPDTIAMASHMDRSTIYKVIDAYLEVAPSNIPEKRSAWHILDYISYLIQRDFERRLQIQREKLRIVDSPKDFFYAVTVTLFTYSEYITALLKHYGECKPIVEILKTAEPMLWAEYERRNGKQRSSIKIEFHRYYSAFCPNLARLIYKWIRAYDCDECYCEFYAVALTEATELLLSHRDTPEELRRIIERKPIASIEPWYSDREWRRMTQRCLKEKEKLKS